MDLKKASTKELEAELETRKKQQLMPPPALDKPDLEKVIQYCKDHVEMIHSEGWANEDMRQYIYEAAMAAVYGEDIWQWMRERLP